MRSLPKDLDDTYARILQTIEDEGNGDRVAKLMQWLAYSARPMPITEIAEVLTVDAENDSLVDVERRFEDPSDLLTICSSLVTTVPQQFQWYFQSSSENEEVLQFAHFSVRKYLESSRIHNGPAGKFAIQRRRAHTLIAESCIMYFLQFDLLQTDLESYSVSQIIEEYPLAKYAARYWYIHAERAGESKSIVPLSKALLTSEGYALSICMKLGDWNYHSCIDAQGKCMPVQYASILNLPKVTGSLISEGADVNSRSKNGWTPLMATSAIRHTPIELIYVLLDHGAVVNAQDDHGCTALILASSGGNLQAVGTLLDNGADIDAHDSSDHTALTRASLCGNAKVVQKLLERGASISSLGSVSALRCAVAGGDYRMSRMLLEGGVSANVYSLPVPGSHIRSPFRLFNTHLLHALDRDKNDIADLLLEYGADVNARSTIKGIRGVALEHALNYGEDNMVNYLLEHGADPSFVSPENLGQSGMKRYEEMLLKIQSQRQPLGVQEEPQESGTDV